MNPLLSKQPVPQVDQIRPEHVLPALEQILTATRQKVDALKADTSAPTFANTYVALEMAMAPLADLARLVGTLEAVLRSPAMVEVVEKMETAIKEFETKEVFQDTLLGSRFGQVDAPTDAQDNYLYELTRQAFESGGAFLSPEDQAVLLKIDARLIQLYTVFNNNVLKGLEEQAVHVTDPAELEGLPTGVVDAMKEKAGERGVEGWLFEPERLLVDRILTVAASPVFRRRILEALESIGNQPGHDNRPVMKEIHVFRQQRAAMLGYADHAAYKLTRTMAGSLDRAEALVEMVLDKAMPKLEQTVRDVSAFAAEKAGVNSLEPADFPYWAARLQAERHACDINAFGAYLPYETSVLPGSFETVSRLLDVTITPNPAHPSYHPDVTSYDVVDNRSGKLAGVLYVDPYSRKEKSLGAWMQHVQTADETRPSVVTLNLNLLKPQPGKPCLVSLDDVETHFHELGHAMHGVLGHENVRYPSLQGTSAPADYTELQAMLLENWGTRPEGLELFARHHETGEAIPPAMLNALKSSSAFMSEALIMRMAANARRDLVAHTTPAVEFTSDVAMQQKADMPHPLAPLLRPYSLHRFSHLFGSGGYAAGYYSYLWSRMLRDDAYRHFAEKGMFDPATSRRLGDLYRAGSSRDPNVLYREFNGKDATSQAMLTGVGIEVGV